MTIFASEMVIFVSETIIFLTFKVRTRGVSVVIVGDLAEKPVFKPHHPPPYSKNWEKFSHSPKKKACP